ncbi:MAG TPA: OmpA family protein, partial [Longimicrobiales bacterium]|nr:OmpA family protein [Longimicrobiales bacterium]
PDADDVCPATPAGAPTDTAGCPLDSDADSVPDYLDRCEGTPQGQPVDELGCTILFEEREGERVPLVLRGVNFELDEALLTPDSYVILEQVAASLVANAEVRVEVAGHTDASGSPELNRALSLSRAEAVRDYLIAQGVAPQRLVARGYGPDQPAASNATEEGRAQNRRVELRLIE